MNDLEPIFRKLSDSFKQSIKTRIGWAIGMTGMNYSMDSRPTLEECYALLGKMHTRLHILNMVKKLMTDGTGVSFLKTPDSIKNLMDLTEKQIGSMNQLIELYFRKGPDMWKELSCQSQSST